MHEIADAGSYSDRDRLTIDTNDAGDSCSQHAIFLAYSQLLQILYHTSTHGVASVPI